MKPTERCPTCGRFMEQDADGFYDREDRDDESSAVLQFCDESCADRFHGKLTRDELSRHGFDSL